MVMKCRREMFASKLFWMYLRGQFKTYKVYIEPAPPIEFNTSCAYPQKDKPDEGKVQRTESGGLLVYLVRTSSAKAQPRPAMSTLTEPLPDTLDMTR